jgi:hypothetical protein
VREKEALSDVLLCTFLEKKPASISCDNMTRSCDLIACPMMLFLHTRICIQEYIPDIESDTSVGATIVVVSLVIEIEGDSTVYVPAEISCLLDVVTDPH